MRVLFFVFFYIMLGTAGISLPALINGDWSLIEISIGLITVVMSSVGYSATERIMQFYDEKPSKKSILFVHIIALVVALVLTVIVCVRLSDKYIIYVALFAYLLSCVFWWYQNWDNRNLENTSSTTLGGDASQFKE